MYVYKRSSLGNNRVQIKHISAYGPQHRRVVSNTGMVWDGAAKHRRKLLWAAVDRDLRKLKRRMRKAGWIK